MVYVAFVVSRGVVDSRMERVDDEEDGDSGWAIGS